MPPAAAAEPAPASPRVSRALTILSAIVLFGFVAFLAHLTSVESPLGAVAEPERALALVVSRTMDVETALVTAPAWERRLYGLTVSEPGRELEQAIAWYEELADHSLVPDVDLRLAILRGEGGRPEALVRMLDEWLARGEPLLTYASVIAAAYGGADEMDAEALGDTVAALGPGWFADVLALRLAVRFDEPALAATARRSIAERARPLLWRLRALMVVDLALIVAALVALRALRRRPPEARVVAAAALPPPWPLGTGLAALVRGGAVSALLLVVLFTGNHWLTERPLVAEALQVPVVFLPVLLIAWRRLLRPNGLGLVEAFGLSPHPGAGRVVLLASLALLGVGVLLDAGLALGGGWLQLDAHWAEWFDSNLAWGPPAAVAITLVATAVLAPVFEEVTFRGLLYGSLRARLGVGPAVVGSALVFAGAHGYGAAGFASVFLSGALWAWTYERTGSLLPAIVAHMANNAAVGFTLLWLLR